MHFEQKSSGEVQKIIWTRIMCSKRLVKLWRITLTAMQEGKIKVDADFKTSLKGLGWRRLSALAKI